MAGAIHNRHAMRKCEDCPKMVPSMGNKKRCDDCQHTIEKARKREKEKRRYRKPKGTPNEAGIGQ